MIMKIILKLEFWNQKYKQYAVYLILNSEN